MSMNMLSIESEILIEYDSHYFKLAICYSVVMCNYKHRFYHEAE